METKNMRIDKMSTESNFYPPLEEEISIKKSIELDIMRIISGVTTKPMDQLSLEGGFYDQGLDSSDLLQIVREIEDRIKKALYPTLLFEYKNVKELVEYLFKEYSSAFQEKTTLYLEESTNKESQRVYYQYDWKKSLINSSEEDIKSLGNILIFDYDDNIINSIIHFFETDNQKVILVKPGKCYCKVNEHTYEISPESEVDYYRLLEELRTKSFIPNQIIHMWSKKKFCSDLSVLKPQMDVSIYSLLYLSKALMHHFSKQNVRLIYLYLSSEDALQPQYSACIGFAKTLQAENPKFLYKMVEIQDAGSCLTVFELSEILLNELKDVERDISEIRYVNFQRYIKYPEKVMPTLIDKHKGYFKENGVYLISGGLGGLGFIFSKYLAEKFNATLVLTGRSELSEEKRSKIKNLEELGSKVLYITCDVSKREEVQALYSRLKYDVGKINGIIHSAGIIRDALILKKTQDEMQDVMAPKVYGTINLDEVLKDEELDFFVMFSSTASVIGNPGQSDYSYSNSFMDHYAELRTKLRNKQLRHGKTLSINWSLWQDGGMKIEKDIEEELKSRIGIIPLSAESGLKAFEETATINGKSQITIIEGIQENIEILIKGSKLDSENGSIDNVEVNKYDELAYEEKDGDNSFKEEIAIIGLNGRYPMGNNIDDFWLNLKNGNDCITEIPKHRWDYNAYYDPDKNKLGTISSKWGGFIDHVDKFDPLFFNISPREAATIDPQERIFLETAWGTVEDAGYTRESLDEKKVGTFVGVMWGHYQLFGNEEFQKGNVSSLALSSYGSIANRVSYFLNFTGPSIALDTMCSSSLTAIHLACESILKGESDLAIAGGVNVSIHPSKYIYLSQQKFLSSDGKCRSFGEDGDGYVPGEGAGAILLKPLSKAIQDGDHIYAVIKGSSISHGGKSSGYHVPNPNAQANLLVETFDKADINPRSITLFEAHGTGTSLGDPIEINGAMKAFRQYTTDKQYCSIGSVKSNIGHLESAAGIAGVTKVLLQMKYKQLVPSLHAENLNSNIEFNNSPFYVQQKLEEWKETESVIGGQEFKYPRRACVSSFGAGGANAHIILEEYEVSRRKNETETKQPQLFILSAKGEEQLYQSTRLLKNYLANQDKQIEDCRRDVNLNAWFRDIAYTLQIGREDMEKRLAIIASSSEELSEKLEGFLNKKSNLDGVFIGNTTEMINSSISREMNPLIPNSNLEELARKWTGGAKVKWDLLYKGQQPSRLSLPTYPFAREKCWISIQSNEAIMNEDYKGKLHPLIDVNESKLGKQIFKKTFSKSEFFLRDHGVLNQIILPGVCYLEMAKVVGEMSIEGTVYGIKDVIWIRPIIMNDPYKEVYISLNSNGNDIFYEIYSEENEQKIIYSKGTYLYKQNTSVHQSLVTKRIDINEIKKRFNRKIEEKDILKVFQKAGFEYGPSFRIIEDLYCGNNEALAKVVLPPHLQGSFSEFDLHPSLMDGILRSITGIGMEDITLDLSLRVPFTLGQLEFIQPLTEVCYSYATVVSDEITQNIKYNIIILSESGEELVRIKNFSARHFHHQSLTNKEEELLYYYPTWKEECLEGKKIKKSLSLQGNSEEQALLIFCDNLEMYKGFSREVNVQTEEKKSIFLVTPSEAYKKVSHNHYLLNLSNPEDHSRLFNDLNQEGIDITHIIYLAEYQSQPFKIDSDSHILIKELDRSLDYSIYPMLYIFNALNILSPKKKIRCLYVSPYNSDEFSCYHETISALAKSFITINHKFELCTLQVSKEESITHSFYKSIISELFSLNNFHGKEIRYLENRRYVKNIVPLDMKDGLIAKEKDLLKKGGVYLITGGTGELGMSIAGYLAKQYQAKLILIGRSPLNPTVKDKITTLENLQVEVMYCQADVSNPDEINKAVLTAKRRFYKVDGVIHAAGNASKVLCTKAGKKEFENVILPKIHGTLNLDKALKNENLDFFVMFSSISSIIGDLGVGSYASANKFMDSFAEWREQLCFKGLRSGKTISINWPLWKEGGMQLPTNEEKKYYDYSGMKGLKLHQGIEAFRDIFKLNLSQTIITNGDQYKINRLLGVYKDSSVPYQEQRNPVNSNKTETDSTNSKVLEKIQRETETYLKTVLSTVIHLPVHRIDAKVDMEKYGIDSVMIMELNDLLKEDFGSLSTTLFFEYKNLHDLAKYLVANYRDELCNLFSIEVQEIKEDRKENLSNVKFIDSFQPIKNEKKQQIASSIEDENVAIIGMSGRYPMADNLEIYFENLSTSKDCITEIPKERWDNNKYYNPEKDNEGKTYSKWGGFINDIDKFDPLFFNIAPSEAKYIDPQERKFLEIAWETIEDAGYTRASLNNQKVGVFVGVMYNQYQLLGMDNQKDGSIFGTGSLHSSIANRVSYAMNFNGPSLAVDTACSSSLESIRLACENIMQNNCELAIAGGVNLSLHPSKYIFLSKSGFLSSNGRCKSFGEGGDGYVPGEGVGAVLLKPLKKAMHDGDHIYGVIKGISVNHGGKTNGYTVPNPNAQSDLIIEALNKAKVDPRTVSYIEAHGTGTALGDPIEITGLTKAFNEFTDDRQFCSIGSVKSNVGHLESAAGIASVTKVLLQMKHKKLVPSIHSSHLNPNINFINTPFYVQQELQEWKQPLLQQDGNEIISPRRAGISGFGAGGTNVHIILEEPPLMDSKNIISTQEPQIFVLSARNEERLIEYAKNMVAFLQKHKEASMEDLAYTLQVGREAMAERLAIIALNRKELIDKLNQYIQGKDYIDNLYLGNAKSNKQIAEVISNGDEGEEFIRLIISNRKLDKLANLWVLGMNVKWENLYEVQKPKRVSLPTYPFEKERYWIIENKQILLNSVTLFREMIDKINKPILDETKLLSLTESYNELNYYLPHALLHIFQKMGVFQRHGEQYEKEILQSQLGILPQYRRLFVALLDILERAGIIQYSGRYVLYKGEVDSVLQKESSSIQERGTQLRKEFPELGAYVQLLDVCL
ncbi:SDR family NAD(P)-dependent oxidoreductase, partial [Priestia megaterium]|uniref:SDR family NAD(P)-dependent oxidoreductase n=1 Tax=Priestia megaterium TaxID=1404 RepID=UPI0012D8D1A1